MKLKMKGNKPMDILTVILTYAVIAIAAIYCTHLYYDSIIDKMNIDHAQFVDKQNLIISGKNKAIADLDYKIWQLEETIMKRDNEIARQKEEINMLNDLIVHASESKDSSKERLPKGPTNMFCYMDYRKLKNQTANQYWLQQECTTNDMGIRTYDGYLCVALGSAYGQDIGDTWRVTLQNGTIFDVILADCKGDDAGSEFGHKCTNYDGQECLNLIEFVVDIDCVDEDVKNAGTFSMLDCFGGLKGNGGNVVKMEYTGRVWERG